MKHVCQEIFKGLHDYSTKVMEFAHVNMTAANDHATSLAVAKTAAGYFEPTNTYNADSPGALTRPG